MEFQPISLITFLTLLQLAIVTGLVPPKFQWKVLDYDWECRTRDDAIKSGDYIPENNMPSGLARWRDKLFITVPRWKPGVPASLNYVRVSGPQVQPLKPYPSWGDAYVPAQTCNSVISNATVVSAFRVHIDSLDRLWVVDNGVADMFTGVRQLADPAVVIFNLANDELIRRFILPEHVLTETSVLTSIVVEVINKNEAYAYITDMGSNALIVYSLHHSDAWRIEHPYFHFDPIAGVYNIGGIEFFWNDGVSACTLSGADGDGFRDLYFHPASCTRQFKVSTKFLRNRDLPKEDVFEAIHVVGNRGTDTQSTACDFDHRNNVLFYTQLSKNGLGCWNAGKPFEDENVQVIFSDCNLLEFPNDVKIDAEGNLWLLSDRQSRFLYDTMDFDVVNFRVLTAPVNMLVSGTACEGKMEGKGKGNKRKSK